MQSCLHNLPLSVAHTWEDIVHVDGPGIGVFTMVKIIINESILYNIIQSKIHVD